MAAVFLVVFGLLLIISALYMYQKKRFRYWAEKNVPHDKPHIIFGNARKVLSQEQSIGEFLHEQYHKYKSERFIGTFAFSQPGLIVKDLELVKDITIKEFSSFANRSFEADRSFDTMAGRFMFGLKDEEWRNVRKRIAPAFSNAKLQSMFSVTSEINSELLAKFEQQIKTGTNDVEVVEFYKRYAIDNITALAFGARAESLRQYPGKPLMYKLFSALLNFDFYQGIAVTLMYYTRPLYIAAGRLGLPFRIFPRTFDNAIIKVVDVAYRKRVQEKERRTDIFDSIVWCDKPGFDGIMNKAAVAGQMMLAGTETTATVTSLTLFELATHPHIQDRLRKEIVDTLKQNNGVATYKLIKEMKYLKQVVNETMRMWPILSELDRLCRKPYRIPGTNIVIEKGTRIYIPVWSLHRDPHYFPDPDKFDPERFSDENVKSIPDMAYLPFGAGPRYCVGKRLGLMNVKVALVGLLQKYEVCRSDETFTEPCFNKTSVTRSLVNGLTLTLKPLP